MTACPVCGVGMELVDRYPNRLCNDCCALASDGNGRRVELANASACGGLAWRYLGDDDWVTNDIRLVALVGSMPVVICEARFGGVVAQPLDPDTPTPAATYRDLR